MVVTLLEFLLISAVISWSIGEGLLIAGVMCSYKDFDSLLSDDIISGEHCIVIALFLTVKMPVKIAAEDIIFFIVPFKIATDSILFS